MRKILSVACLCGITLSLTACGPQTMYSWGKYDTAMYAYARDVDRQVEFQQALQDVIKDNEADGKKVPPGIYAEYGYQMLEMGRNNDAVKFFEREKMEWPEAKSFMETMISYVTGGGSVKESSDAAKSPKTAEKQAAAEIKTTETN